MATTSLEGLQKFLEGMSISNQSLASTVADVNNDPLAVCFSHLADLLVQLTGCGHDVAYRSIVWANDMSHLVVVTPRLRLKGRNSEELAADLQHRWSPSPLFAHPVNDGINLLFYFEDTALARFLLPYIIDRGPLYGEHSCTEPSAPNDTDAKRQKVLVEFSSPNLGMPFTGLHLRSTTIGACLASIYASMGWDVCRMNFLGDWGKHMGILAAGWPRFGSQEAFEADPLRHLIDVCTQTDELLKQQETADTTPEEQQNGDVPASQDIEKERDQYFRRLEDGDPDAIALWTKLRDACVAKYIELYARLGVTFDEYSGESYARETIEEVEDTLRRRDVYRQTEDGWFIEFSRLNEKGFGSVKARSQDGTTSYLLRDIACVLERNNKHSFDKMIYVVSDRQITHFKQVRKALKLMDLADLAHRIEHVSFGGVHGLLPKEGTSGLLLGDILDQCRDATKLALDTDQDSSGHFFGHDPATIVDTVTSMNVMVGDLSTRRASTLDFDLTKMATVGEYTSMNLQKWLTTLVSRLAVVHVDPAELETADYAIFEGEDTAYADVLRLLIQLPGIVRTSFEKMEPSHILTFLFNIIDTLPNIWGEEAEAEGSTQSLAKLALYECLRQTLENGMKILGLSPLTT